MNLLEETKNSIPEGKEIAWAIIIAKVYERPTELFILKPNHTNEQKDIFFRCLDFEYDNGYGCQEVDGKIVFTDNSWIQRGEYDGSEWWTYLRCPQWDK